MLKDDLNVYAFQNKNWLSPKSDRWFFFKIWLSEGLSIERIFNEKKYESTGLISEKTEALYVLLYAVLNKRAEAATSSYSVTGDFLYIYIHIFCACDWESSEHPIKVFSSWIFPRRSWIY